MTIFGIAGTFNRIHDGHRALFKAIQDLTGDDDLLIIGVTSDEFARKGRDVPVRSFVIREALVYSEAMRQCGCLWRYCGIRTCQIDSLEQSLELGAQCDYVVVSEESLDRARPMLGKTGGPVLIVVPCVRGKDGKKISASDIVKQEEEE